MRRGSETRERILDIAEVGVLSKGFGATSIDEIIAEAEITKSGFFYHFRDKNALAHGLLLRYGERNDQLLTDVFGRAASLSSDPLQRLLIGLTLFAEHMAAQPNGHPGCLVATMSYQDRLFDRGVRSLIAELVRHWNDYFSTLISEVIAAHPAGEAVDPDRLARTIVCAIDGGILMGKALGEPDMLPEQVLMVRNYIRMLFQPAMPMRVAA